MTLTTNHQHARADHIRGLATDAAPSRPLNLKRRKDRHPMKSLLRTLAALILAIAMRRKRTVRTLAALLLAIGLIAGAVSIASAQDVTTWATPVPEAPDASGLAALVVAILVALILAILAGR